MLKLCPQKNIGLVTLDNDEARLKKVFNQGYNEAKEDDNLKRFLE